MTTAEEATRLAPIDLGRVLILKTQLSATPGARRNITMADEGFARKSID